MGCFICNERGCMLMYLLRSPFTYYMYQVSASAVRRRISISGLRKRNAFLLFFITFLEVARVQYTYTPQYTLNEMRLLGVFALKSNNNHRTIPYNADVINENVYIIIDFYSRCIVLWQCVRSLFVKNQTESTFTFSFVQKLNEIWIRNATVSLPNGRRPFIILNLKFIEG